MIKKYSKQKIRQLEESGERPRGYYNHYSNYCEKEDDKWFWVSDKRQQDLIKIFSAKTPIPKKPKSKIKPGSVLKSIIAKATGEEVNSGCSCNDRSLLMDCWGYKLCWKNRHLIKCWLKDEANKRGFEVTNATIRSLILSLVKTKKEHEDGTKQRNFK